MSWCICTAACMCGRALVIGIVHFNFNGVYNNNNNMYLRFTIYSPYFVRLQPHAKLSHPSLWHFYTCTFYLKLFLLFVFVFFFSFFNSFKFKVYSTFDSFVTRAVVQTIQCTPERSSFTAAQSFVLLLFNVWLRHCVCFFVCLFNDTHCTRILDEINSDDLFVFVFFFLWTIFFPCDTSDWFNFSLNLSVWTFGLNARAHTYLSHNVFMFDVTGLIELKKQSVRCELSETTL